MAAIANKIFLVLLVFVTTFSSSVARPLDESEEEWSLDDENWEEDDWDEEEELREIEEDWDEEEEEQWREIEEDWDDASSTNDDDDDENIRELQTAWDRVLDVFADVDY